MRNLQVFQMHHTEWVEKDKNLEYFLKELQSVHVNSILVWSFNLNAHFYAALNFEISVEIFCEWKTIGKTISLFSVVVS